MENLILKSDVEQKYHQLLELEPKLVTSTVPSNAAEQKRLFLEGSLTIPDHHYPKLDVDGNRLIEIASLGESIVSSPELDRTHIPVYEEFLENYLKKTQMMQAMHLVKNVPTEQEHSQAREEFMNLNIELYGAPEESVYRSILQEKLSDIEAKDLHESAYYLKAELQALIPDTAMETNEAIERFKPSQETIDWMHDAVDALYAPMLRHVPDQESFTVPELQHIFSEILTNEFGESAAEWSVDVESAKSITVKSSEKRIVIPENRGNLSREMVSKLVVHEIGVHVLRSITGGQADIGPLRTGLVDYYDAEEGLGKVMEQALVGRFGEAGKDHYVTAGAAYFDGMDFRKSFELKWRLAALEKLQPEEPLTSEAIVRAKETAYGGVMRIFRGTDELPWFKDLAYYNGSVEIWKFLETIRGDDFRLTLLLMGKMNTSQKHLHTLLESRSQA